MTDILQLKDWAVLGIEEQQDQTIISAEYAKQPEFCLLCGVVGELYKHGPRSVTILDSPIRGTPTRIVAKVQRYKCRACGGTFPQPLSGVDAVRRMTERCLRYIEQQCLRDTFQHLSEHLGCDEKTIRNIAADYIAVTDGEYRPYLPEWLGLDENHLNKIFRAIITDVENRRVVDMLSGRNKPMVSRWFSQFRDRSKVRVVTIDMWQAYRDVSREMLPNAAVVIDKFHVVKMANSAIDKVRIRVQKGKDKKMRLSWKQSKHQLLTREHNLSDKQRFNLSGWRNNEPEIDAAYNIKEALFGIYDLPKAKAIAAFDAFAATIPASMTKEFHELTRAMQNWRTEILNYFDFPTTNAYTESMNGIAKMINRAGRGYSFEVIRSRLLFANSPTNKRTLRARRAASEAALTRCSNCTGLYPDSEIFTVDHVVPYAGEDVSGPDMVFHICKICHARFTAFPEV